MEQWESIRMMQIRWHRRLWMRFADYPIWTRWWQSVRSGWTITGIRKKRNIRSRRKCFAPSLTLPEKRSFRLWSTAEKLPRILWISSENICRVVCMAVSFIVFHTAGRLRQNIWKWDCIWESAELSLLRTQRNWKRRFSMHPCLSLFWKQTVPICLRSQTEVREIRH